MKLKDKNILLISPESWHHLFVSKHHYAVRLGTRNNKVFFLNPPSGNNGIECTEYANVLSVSYRGFPTGMRFYPSVLQRYFISNEFEALQRRCGVTFDIVWSFDNSVFFDFSALPANLLKICHIVDSSQDFQFSRAASTADYCFCVTGYLKKKLALYNSRVVKINHGYANGGIIRQSSSFKLPGKNSVKVMYAGNLDTQYIDWPLVHKLIAKSTNVDFCFAGSKSADNQNVKRLSAHDNFHYLGKLQGDDLIRHLELADIMLLTYRADEFREQLANSHKVMEYLASGKVLVATYTDELKLLREQQLICMSDSNEQFYSLFTDVVKDLSKWNSIEKQQKRKEYASENTYDKQIERIESILTDHAR